VKASLICDEPRFPAVHSRAQGQHVLVALFGHHLVSSAPQAQAMCPREERTLAPLALCNAENRHTCQYVKIMRMMQHRLGNYRGGHSDTGYSCSPIQGVDNVGGRDFFLAAQNVLLCSKNRQRTKEESRTFNRGNSDCKTCSRKASAEVEAMLLTP
jgi:hypothetical protein